MLPPEMMSPTRLPAKRCGCSSIHASGTAADGSTTNFIRSNIMRMALTMLASLAVKTPAAPSRMIGKVMNPIDVLKPSAMVFAVALKGMRSPALKERKVSSAAAGSAP